MNTNFRNGRGIGSMLKGINVRRGMAWGIIIVGALLAFEIFNYSTTEYALADVVGHLLSPVPGEAMHENIIRFCRLRGLLVNLVGTKVPNPLLLLFLAPHAVIGVGVNDIRILEGLFEIMGENDLRPALFGSFHGELKDFWIGIIPLRMGNINIKSHGATGNHQGVTDIPNIAHIGQFKTLEISFFLPNRQ